MEATFEVPITIRLSHQKGTSQFLQGGCSLSKLRHKPWLGTPRTTANTSASRELPPPPPPSCSCPRSWSSSSSNARSCLKSSESSLWALLLVGSDAMVVVIYGEEGERDDVEKDTLDEISEERD
ncbi:hypothetical protein SLEP1_g36239 [Rubroshorea leprosula]|uniref:Uncharacterized protein n=1 Tax=Rubroshorea leprosula TaxID=152421 RepID=A0AAV5KR10_9ROSI|nr:hypothetical protein SLEP1_g36239 [Rubroshorea leprosula]